MKLAALGWVCPLVAGLAMCVASPAHGQRRRPQAHPLPPALQPQIRRQLQQRPARQALPPAIPTRPLQVELPAPEEWEVLPGSPLYLLLTPRPVVIPPSADRYGVARAMPPMPPAAARRPCPSPRPVS